MPPAVAQFARIRSRLALRPVQWLAAGADLPLARAGHRVRTGALRLTEDLVHGDVQRGEIVQGVHRDRRGGREAHLGLVQPQGHFDVREDQFVGAGVPTRGAPVVAVLGPAAVLRTEFFGPSSDVLLGCAVGATHLDHLLLDLFPVGWVRSGVKVDEENR